MSVPTGRLRDKRPAFYSIYKSDFLIMQQIAPRERPYALAAYNVLAFHANSDTDTAFPSYSTIGKLSGMSKRKAVEAIALLVGVGLLTVRHRKDESGDPTSNEYTLVTPPSQVMHSVHQVYRGVHDGDAQRALPLMHSVHTNENESEQDEMNEEDRARAQANVAAIKERQRKARDLRLRMEGKR